MFSIISPLSSPSLYPFTHEGVSQSFYLLVFFGLPMRYRVLVIVRRGTVLFVIITPGRVVL